jgi:alpha-L-rhamnosidase
MVTPTRLRVEYMESPVGVDAHAPRFSWALASHQRGAVQSAYELGIRAVESHICNFSWSSGRVVSNRTLNVPYTGAEELPHDCSFIFDIIAFDADGELQTTRGSFSTGINDWSGARWLGLTGSAAGFQARRSVLLAKPVRRAFAYVSGLGYYKLDVDGERVSTHELGPFTTFSTRVYYDTLDVTEPMAIAAALKSPCVFGATVGPGWYTLLGVGPPTLRLLVSIEYEDGTRERVVSDGGWRVSPGPVVSSNIYDGEVYDARRETPGWTTPAFQLGSAWTAPALLAGPPGGSAVQYSSHAVLPPVRIGQSYAPCDMWEVVDSPGTYVFDFCQNMAGFTTLNIREGIFTVSNITQVHAEAVHGPKPAAIYNQLATYTLQTNSYLSRGDGKPASYTPLFTFAGFRYVQLSGLPLVPDFNTLEAHFIHTDFELTGDIEFSAPLLNSVQHAARASALSNFQSIPSDCPQRERRGWLGDSQLAAEALFHNFDVSAALSAFVQQIDDAQNKATGEVQDCVPWYGHGFEPADPAWGAAYSLLSDWIGTYSHDSQIFARHYVGITAHLDSVIKMAAGGRLPGGANNPHPGPHGWDGLLAFGPYSDWCPAKGCSECDDPRKDPAAYNSALVSSYYLIKQLKIVGNYAALLGHEDDAVRYAAVAANTSQSFVRHFYDATAKTFREPDRNCTQYLSPQTSISLGNELGLVPAGDEEPVMKNLVAGSRARPSSVK